MAVYTVAWPLDVDGAEDTYKTYDETQVKEVVKFNVKSTILTCPGERRSDPNFGVCVKKYLFEIIDEALLEEIYQDIRNQLRIHVPYCLIKDLEVSYEGQSGNGIRILLQYYIAEVNLQDELEILLPTETSL